MKFPVLILTSLMAQGLLAATLTVGPNKTYSTPCLAFQNSKAGDIIEIDASGTYAGDVCAIHQSSLTIRGMGGRAVIDAAGRNAEGKGIWVIKGSNTVVENIEFRNAKVPDKNGAGIRHEGTNLIIRNSNFQRNENGILTTSNPNSEILVERSEFGFNGAGDGYSHNLYIGKIKKFTLISSFSHDANIGHLVKSRAEENHILYNRLTNENNGNASYEVDLPNGGRSYVIGNVIHQGPSASNSGILTYAAEGASNAAKDLYIINNTFVNDRSNGTFVMINSSVTVAPVARNNVFAGTGTLFNTSNIVNQNNYANANPAFVNRAGYDYRPAAGAPFINAGINPGSSSTGFSLTPTLEYVHPIATKARPVVGALDIGAFEYSTGTTPPPTQPPPPTPNPPPDSQSPVVNVTAPANGGTVRRYSTVSITVSATDNVGMSRVEIFVNGMRLCRDTAAPYACSWRVPGNFNRTYQIQAVGYDTAGNRGNSAVIRVRAN